MIIYMDENMPGHLAEGFHIIQFPESIKTQYVIEVKFLPSRFGCGAQDVDWLPVVGSEGSCIITQDKKLSKRKSEIELYKKHKVGIFFMRGPSKKQGLKIWDMTQALAKNWDEICRIAKEDTRPFGYVFKLKGKMERLEL